MVGFNYRQGVSYWRQQKREGLLYFTSKKSILEHKFEFIYSTITDSSVSQKYTNSSTAWKIEFYSPALLTLPQIRCVFREVGASELTIQSLFFAVLECESGI